MTKEHTDKLVKDFPTMFQYYTVETRPLVPMYFGFECGDGWFDIIYELTKKLFELDPDIRVMQVKEKFAGLRYYILGTTRGDEVFSLINDAEKLSYETCEACGTTENVKVRGQGWVYTRCEKCKDLSARDIR